MGDNIQGQNHLPEFLGCCLGSMALASSVKTPKKLQNFSRILLLQLDAHAMKSRHPKGGRDNLTPPYGFGISFQSINSAVYTSTTIKDCRVNINDIAETNYGIYAQVIVNNWASLTPLSHPGRAVASFNLLLYFFSNRSCC